MPVSSPADVGCEDKTHVRDTDGWNIPFPHLFLALGDAGRFLELHPECQHQGRLPLENSTLLCKWMLVLHTWWGSSCSPYCEPNITGRFLSCTQNYHTNIKHDLLKIWTVVKAVTQNRHFQSFTTKFTQPGAHRPALPVLIPLPCWCGVRAGWPGGGRSLLPCCNTELT